MTHWSANRWPRCSRTFATQVYQAADGQEGLEILEQHPDISVIVTDIAMPRLDGIAFASKARRLHPELKVLFVSGMQRPPGSEEFLAKPFRARRAGLGAEPAA